MLNIEAKDIKLIGIYLGYYNDGIYIETKNHYYEDFNYTLLNDYKKIALFDPTKSIIKWNGKLWKYNDVRIIFTRTKRTHRFEQIQDAGDFNIIDISSESVADIVIIYTSKDPESVDIQEIVVDNIIYEKRDFIGDFDSFYAYYNPKNELINED